MDKVNMKALFDEYNLSDLFQRISHLMKDTIQFKPSRRPDKMIPVGASKLGGLPDLPVGTAWPRHANTDIPLSFVCQVNFADSSVFDALDELPEQGMLYLFYDYSMDGMPWGFDPAHAPGTKVFYYHGSPDTLRRTNAPTELLASEDTGRVFGSALLQFERNIELPAELEEYGVELSEDEQDSYWAMLDDTAEESGISKLLGYSNNIQGTMELECELVTNGLYCGDASGYRDRRAKELEKNASQWRLLLQIDSDEKLGMEWGDCGRLYVWIRECDLHVHNFSHTWLILQCY